MTPEAPAAAAAAAAAAADQAQAQAQVRSGRQQDAEAACTLALGERGLVPAQRVLWLALRSQARLAQGRLADALADADLTRTTPGGRHAPVEHRHAH